ncbi:MAG TPA: M20 aminoacylase family protein [Stellaceae bacterium]|nr:M20 aminoacylase family protein [Stellaceae bacterium]
MPPLDAITAYHNDMTAWRRDIHAHPELGFEETRTADLVAAKLEQFGIEVTRGIGKTGLVGRLQVGNSPRSIGLRADMDCLPILEANTFGHRSTHNGKMHACGHDGHTTMLLGAARYLSQTRNFDGTVHFIFQPAEEGLGGASAMLDDGLFERFPCDVLFGMHNRPGLAVGKFQTRSGAMMASGAYFDIDITGVGSHGARPESGVDPVVVGSAIASALQTIVSRNVRPVETAVVSITRFHAGQAYNVIPDKAVLGGTVRCFSDQVMTLVEERMRHIAESVAAGFGAKAELDFRLLFPVLMNHTDETQFILDCAADVVGEENINRSMTPTMASEDFAWMLRVVPGAYIQIGNGDVDGEGACEVHNPGYDFNDAALPFGSSLFVKLVEKRLDRLTG